MVLSFSSSACLITEFKYESLPWSSRIGFKTSALMIAIGYFSEIMSDLIVSLPKFLPSTVKWENPMTYKAH